MTTFQELGLAEPLLKALAKLGYREPTEVQQATFGDVIAGNDVVVSAKTGSGKTAAFLLPMLHRLLQQDRPRSSTRALILLPTRELAYQTAEVCTQFAAYTSIKSGIIVGGEAYRHQVASIRKNPEILIATPGRLVEHIEKGNIDFSDIELLVLDEADRMLDMGFAEAMHTISESCTQTRQSVLLSATFQHKGFQPLIAQLKQPVHHEIKCDELATIHQQIVLSDSEHHKYKLTAAIVSEHLAGERDDERVCVFCHTRSQSQKVSNMLRAKKLRSNYLHSELAPSERKQVLQHFRDGRILVLVTTDLAARGLDVPGLGLVINFTVAQSGDDHVHRIGRTGRAGKQGVAVTLVGAEEWHQMSSIERYLRQRFEVRKVEGLEASYTGPKKLKQSGKAAGKKKKHSSAQKSQQKRTHMKKNRADTSGSAKPSHGDGFGVLKRKK